MIADSASDSSSDGGGWLDGADQNEYERLIALVKEATQQNLGQAALVGRIKELGDVAIRIARRVPSLASLI